MSRASRAASCPIAAASAPIARNATRSQRMAIRALRCNERAQSALYFRNHSNADGRTTMSTNFNAAADAVLNDVVTSNPRVPGVVAMVTNRHRNIYEGAAGKRRLDQAADMTTDSIFAIFSTTKAITATAVLQLVEEGKLDLDAPAKSYAPDIGKLQVIEGFDAAGEPILRAPRRAITTRMLMVHTAGLGYDFINHTYNRLAQDKGQPSVI